MSIRLYRLTTGEDVVGAPQEKENTTTHTAIKKPFVLIPMQGKPGENVRIGFQPYIPYTEDEIIMIKNDNIICNTTPGENILKAYETNTTNLVKPDTKLIM
tara:strand:+ start:1314 stop:1616 length:303 start_codon:yes stop_codon:yes gene_type:complete